MIHYICRVLGFPKFDVSSVDFTRSSRNELACTVALCLVLRQYRLILAPLGM
jgi:hypothetical protein